MPLRTLLAFDLRGTGFAVELQDVIEVVRMVAPTPLPGVAPDVLGVVDYRGTVVPLLDPARRLGLEPRTPGVDSKIVIASTSSGPLGIVVDELRGLVEADPGEYRARDAMPIPAGAIERALVRGTVRKPDGLVLALDLELLLTSEEHAHLRAETAPREHA